MTSTSPRQLSRASLQAYDLLAYPVWAFSFESFRIIYSNSAAQAWLGYTEAELESLSIFNLRPAEERPIVQRTLARFGAEVLDAGAWTINGRTGSHHASFFWRKVVLDGAVAVVASISETTGTAEAQQAIGGLASQSDEQTVQAALSAVKSQSSLAEAARLRRIAGHAARLGGWRVNLDPMEMTWSPETAAIHEERPDFVPSLERGFAYYAPEHQPLIRSAFAACAETGEPYDEVLRLITAKGNPIWVRAIGEAVRNEHGDIIAVEGAFQDISELVAMRDEADLLARRLRHTLESISDAFFLLDRDWRFLFLNGQAEKVLGRKREELEGKVLWDEFPEALGTAFQSQYERAVQTNRSIHFQEPYPPLSAWFEVVAHPTGEGLAVYFLDITERRLRDEQLRLLEAAVSHQSDILLITEAKRIDAPEGPKIVYVNEAFVAQTGYSREEVIGKTPRILQGPRTQAAELGRIRDKLENLQPVRAELINYRKDGSEFWLELDIVPLADPDGDCTHFVAVQRDITDRRHAEESIRINDERFRLVARATNDVIWDWDLRAGTVWWNENLKSLFGYDPSEVGPGPETWIKRIHPDDVERVLQSIHAVIDGAGSNWASEYRFLRKDGTAGDVIDRGFVIRDEAGTAVRMLGSMLDVSEQRELEARLRQSQKLEAVGQLTGGVAHDFNNLLTVILGNAEVLREELGADDRLHGLASMISTAAERGAELTNRLLAFARKQPLTPRITNLNKLLAGMEQLLRRTLGEHIDIEIIRSGGLWLTEIDPGQLEAAILNLAINARDAMIGGGCLTLETANAFLDEDYAEAARDVTAGQYVLLTITDTGHGIARDVLPRVFEPFYTTKEAGKGSGLGLSMVYGFIKQSGGHIGVYSELGEGTAVRLYLPRSFQDEPPPAAAMRRPEGRGDGELILLVEDDHLVRQHLETVLRTLGYRVLAAATGESALTLLGENPDIRLLFTDVVMPGGMNGRQLAAKAMEVQPDLKVLYTSGYTENAIVHHGLLDPGIEFLSKPFDRRKLAGKLRKILG